MIDRRFFLKSLAATSLLSACGPLAGARADVDRYFLFVIQRGAADGLSTVIPTGAPQLISVRPGLIDEAAGGTQLDSTFTLAPQLEQLGRLYGQDQALFAHALATPYRERSHFDGQNMLETGGPAPYRLDNGWLNRFVTLLPGGEAMAVSTTIPLVLRGSAPVSSYAPLNLPDANEDLLARVTRLYDQDPQLHAIWAEALETHEIAGGTEGRLTEGAPLGQVAGQLMADPGGPKVLVLETSGWDTHAAQKTKLAQKLRQLDAMVGAFRTAMGDRWANTAVAIATEFGRTVHENGTGGTDHGTGSAAMLIGGAVNGGRVVSDWPGIAPGQLYQDRDLRPTGSVEGFIGGALAEHYHLDPELVQRTVFPAIERGAMMEQLIRT